MADGSPDRSPDFVELVPIAREGDVVTAQIVLHEGGRRTAAGEVRYGSWSHLLVVYSLDAADPVAERGAIRILAGRFRDPQPPRDLYHLGARSLDAVRAWADAGLADGLMLTGVIGGRNLYHDRYATLRLDPEDEVGPAGLVVGWAREVAALPTLFVRGVAGVLEMLAAPTSSARIGGLRAMSVDPDVDPALREQAFLLALLDGSFEVRRLAGLLLIGFLPDVRWRIPPRTLIAHLERPLTGLSGSTWRPFVPDGGFRPDRGARNKRLAALFVLGGMFRLAGDLPENVAWREQARQIVLRRLRPAVAAWTPADDARLARAVHRELTDGGPLVLGEARMSLWATLRYVMLRRGLLARAAGREDDRFHWVAELVDALVPPGPGKVAPALHAPPPRGVPRLRALPPMWAGKVPATATEVGPG